MGFKGAGFDFPPESYCSGRTPNWALMLHIDEFRAVPFHLAYVEPRLLGSTCNRPPSFRRAGFRVTATSIRATNCAAPKIKLAMFLVGFTTRQPLYNRRLQGPAPYLRCVKSRRVPHPWIVRVRFLNFLPVREPWYRNLSSTSRIQKSRL